MDRRPVPDVAFEHLQVLVLDPQLRRGASHALDFVSARREPWRTISRPDRAVAPIRAMVGLVMAQLAAHADA